MGDSLSQLLDAESPYFDVALIIVVVLWEVRNGVAVGRAMQLPSILVYLIQIALILVYSCNILSLVGSGSCLYNCVAAISRVAK